MKPPNFWRSFCFKSNSTQISLMPQIVFAAFLFPTDFTDNTDFRPDRSEVIVTLISQTTQIFDLFGLRFRRFCFWEKVIFCSSLQYRSALVVTRMRIILFILLLIGLHLGRFPSELWQKSYDRHWPYVPKWNRRAMLYLLKPSSTSCLILLATSNCSSRTII